MRLAVVALLLVGCGRGAPARVAHDAAVVVIAPPIDAAPPDAAPPRLAWVNPARCVSPCAREPAGLVTIDAGGKPAPAGAFRVDPIVVEPLGQLIAAAGAAGFALHVESAYRSYDDQAEVFRTTKQIGRAARPGHSEHQLGTALDLDMPTKKSIAWLAAHAAEHGFVVSYPPGKHRVTGYRPEPWHVRFVGEELAPQVPEGGTLEELLRSRPGLGGSGSCADCPLDSSRAPCGDVTAAGRCDGEVLQWCYDGALAAVHCGTVRATCGASGEIFDCR